MTGEQDHVTCFSCYAVRHVRVLSEFESQMFRDEKKDVNKIEKQTEQQQKIKEKKEH